MAQSTFIYCPACGQILETPVAIESVLCQDKYLKVNFVRVEVQHECNARKTQHEKHVAAQIEFEKSLEGRVENTGS